MTDTEPDPRWHVTYDLTHGIGNIAIRAATLEDAQAEAERRYGDAVISVEPATDPRRHARGIPVTPRRAAEGRNVAPTVAARDIANTERRIIPDREAR